MLRGKFAVSMVAIYGSTAVLGALIGNNVGEVDNHLEVSAAAVPAFVTVVAGVVLAFVKVFGKAFESDDDPLRPLAHTMMIMATFAIFFTVSARQTAITFVNAEYNAKIAAWQAYSIVLEECSKREHLINSGREGLGLDPLPTESFCPTVRPHF